MNSDDIKTIYDYFSDVKENKHYKAVAVITNKQYVFEGAFDSNDYRTHNDIISDDEKKIHPGTKLPWNGLEFCYPNHVIVCLSGYTLTIFPPENHELSLNQVMLLSDVLDDVERFNNENKNNKIEITVLHSEFDHSIEDIGYIKNFFFDRVSNYITVRDENIIGRTLSDDRLNNCLSYYTSISDCSTIGKLNTRLYEISYLMNDNYFHDGVVQLFPNFERVFKQTSLLKYVVYDSPISNISISNIEETLDNYINNLYSNKHNISEILSTSYSLNSYVSTRGSNELLNEYFPDFNLFMQLLTDDDIIQDSVEINKIFEKCNSYIEIKNALLEFSYYSIQEKMKIQKDTYRDSNKQINELERMKFYGRYKNIFIETNNKIEELDKQKSSCQVDLLETDMIIKSKEDERKKNKELLEKYNKGLGRIINKKIIIELTNKLDSLRKKLRNLSSKRDDIETKIEDINIDVLGLKEEFKHLTNDKITFDEYSDTYKSFDQEECDINISDHKDKMNTSFESLKVLKQKLELIKDSFMKQQDSNPEEEVIETLDDDGVIKR